MSKTANAAKAGASLAAVIGACGLAARALVSDEGWENIAYPDPAAGAALATACAGVTEGVKLGQRYSDEQCKSMTAVALIKTGLGIAECLPETLPSETRAAFTRMAYNVGVAKFCGSSVAIEARAGNLATACVRMNQRPNGQPQWVYAKIAGQSVAMPGLVKRRASERAQCEAGLS